MDTLGGLRVHLRKPGVDLRPTDPSRLSFNTERDLQVGSGHIVPCPSRNALKYSMVPPTSNGVLPLAVISSANRLASAAKSAAE